MEHRQKGIKGAAVVVTAAVDLEGVEGKNCCYMLRCRDDSLYTGWTNNLPARVRTHQAGKGGKYTRARLPVELIYYEVFATKEEAMSREYAVKHMSRREKEGLLVSGIKNE